MITIILATLASAFTFWFIDRYKKPKSSKVTRNHGGSLSVRFNVTKNRANPNIPEGYSEVRPRNVRIGTNVNEFGEHRHQLRVVVAHRIKDIQ